MPLGQRMIRNTDLSQELVDERVVHDFVQGDIRAFEKIYATFRQRVFSYCHYYMGDQALAEDAFQEVFTRAYTRREQLREARALKSWLLLITRSVCLNLLRTSKFTPQFVSIDEESTQEDRPLRFERELSEQTIDQTLSSDVLMNALAKLGPIYREAFLLREIEGYDYEEVAEITGASVLNVKVRITRAKKQLRLILAPYFSEELESRKRYAERAEAKAARNLEQPTGFEQEQVFSPSAFSPGEEALAI